MQEYATAASPELGSNFYEIRNRIDAVTASLNAQVERLERKNRQLIHFPPQDKNSVSVSDRLGAAALSVQAPLLSEIDESVRRLDIALNQLANVVAITETI